jgi:hypothetical protein
MTTYTVVRFFANPELDEEVLTTGLSLDEARAHCRDPESSSRTCTGRSGRAITKVHGPWFDGYREEPAS